MLKADEISDKLFWGFNTIIDISNHSSIDEIADIIKKEFAIFSNIIYC